MIIEDIEAKLAGIIPINKQELIYFVNSWEKKENKELNLKNYYLSNLDVSKIKDLSFVFVYSMYNGDLSKWDVSNCENMNSMFYDSEFNNNSISNWDVSNVKDMTLMFTKSNFNQNLSKWNTFKLKKMSWMFANSEFNNDSLKDWNVSNVKYMDALFFESKFNGNISNWDVSNCENMTTMFFGTKFNRDISKWNFKNLINSSNMFTSNTLFKNKKVLNYIKNLNLEKRKEFLKIENFKEKIKGEIPITKVELLQLINSWGRFEDNNIRETYFSCLYISDLKNKCYPLEELDVSQIEDLSYLFYSSMYNGDLSKWDVSNCVTMKNMFCNSLFNNDSISNWNLKNCENIERMFSQSNFNGDLSSWNVSNIKYISYIFYNSEFNNNSISKWKLNKVNSFNGIFYKTNFIGDISEWNLKENLSYYNFMGENKSFYLLYNNGIYIDDKIKGSFYNWFKDKKDFINLQYNLIKGFEV